MSCTWKSKNDRTTSTPSYSPTATVPPWVSIDPVDIGADPGIYRVFVHRAVLPCDVRGCTTEEPSPALFAHQRTSTVSETSTAPSPPKADIVLPRNWILSRALRVGVDRDFGLLQISWGATTIVFAPTCRNKYSIVNMTRRSQKLWKNMFIPFYPILNIW